MLHYASCRFAIDATICRAHAIATYASCAFAAAFDFRTPIAAADDAAYCCCHFLRCRRFRYFASIISPPHDAAMPFRFFISFDAFTLLISDTLRHWCHFRHYSLLRLLIFITLRLLHFFAFAISQADAIATLFSLMPPPYWYFRIADGFISYWFSLFRHFARYASHYARYATYFISPDFIFTLILPLIGWWHWATLMIFIITPY